MKTDRIIHQCSPYTIYNISTKLPELKNLTNRVLNFEHEIKLFQDGFIRIISSNLEGLTELDSKLTNKFKVEGIRFNEQLQSYVLVVRYWLIPDLYDTVL